MAGRDARHRPPRVPPLRGPTTVDRYRWPPLHRVRHQHPRHRLDATHPRTTPPPTRPRRGPHPQPQRHRTGQPAVSGIRQEPDLAGNSLSSNRTTRIDTNPVLGPPRTNPAVGTQTTTPTHPRRSRTHHPIRTTPTPTTTPQLAPPRGHHHRLDRTTHHLSTTTITHSVTAARTRQPRTPKNRRTTPEPPHAHTTTPPSPTSRERSRLR